MTYSQRLRSGMVGVVAVGQDYSSSDPYAVVWVKDASGRRHRAR